MDKVKKYIKKERIPVIAIRLNLDTDGFIYNKWGGQQKCKGGDWIVFNQGETYTIDADSFAATYEEVALGAYVKTAPVYAYEAMCDGHIDTKEGISEYRVGDFVTFNNEDMTDGYPVGRDKFLSMYVETENASEKSCADCKYCFMESSDMNFACGHPESGSLGIYINHGIPEHCGPDRSKFEQHPLRARGVENE